MGAVQAVLALGSPAASQGEQGGLTPQQKVSRLLHSVGEAAAASQSQEYPWRNCWEPAPSRGSCTALGTAQVTDLVIYITSTDLFMDQRMAVGAKWLQVFHVFVIACDFIPEFTFHAGLPSEIKVWPY